MSEERVDPDERKIYTSQAHLSAMEGNAPGFDELVDYLTAKMRAQFAAYPEVPPDQIRYTWVATIVERSGLARQEPWDPALGWPPYCTEMRVEARYET